MDLKNEPSKSWFCVLNNPEKHFHDGTPEEIVDKVIEIWTKDNPQRTCAVAYCISAKGLKHLHCVFEDKVSFRPSKIIKLYKGIHVEPTRAKKSEADDYINKRKAYSESGEQIIVIKYHGEIKGKQGKRNDISSIEELIEQGLTPNEIFDISLAYRKYEKIIKDAYYRKRYKETPLKRDVKVYWHYGKSGTGKSFTYLKLAEKYGEDNIYRVNEYTTGFMDKYSGEPILFMDELRKESLSYTLLLSILEGYKSTQIHSRYTNVYCLWNEVHITSIFSPNELYQQMYLLKNDTYEQLRRRISFVVYHYKKNDEFLTKEMTMDEFRYFDESEIINR